ncbi:flagellar protein FliO/FliZ [Tamilnaduibacter salinus]|uniref:Flagellar protein n=1 Tax=Tamilnaduibacter salinus TaxID=1484056 RepID=A0A2A2I6K8_9GAMM|nr:flagellar biosynthetic protein FliO [Tamilnaduibacter salinus]PAV27369.1 flagellar biosynthetic protein FliO [Tamilnaduibacter salinus]PVY79258.1 flagellar protein FliO/FliZ [Tamilnaduibacter salinus]
MGSRLISPWLLLVVGLLAPLVRAQESAGSERASYGPDSLVSLLTLGASLVAVIAVIIGCAWLIRRMNGMTGVNHHAMKVVSVLAVGSRERIALVEVGGTQILVGITPSAIRTLHVFDEPVVESRSMADSDFARRLQSMIGRGWSRSGRGDHDGGEH